MADVLRWKAASAWLTIAKPGRGGAEHGEPGIRVELIEATHVVALVAQADTRDDLARIVGEGLGAALPASGRVAEGREGFLVWAGPDHWSVFTREALSAPLRRDLEAIAAVTDQSSARALVQVSGRDARDALAKGFAIDLHPTAFAVGHTAVTSVAHIGVQIWHRETGRYTIAVPRSFASSFWSWLIGASAAYGYEIVA